MAHWCFHCTALSKIDLKLSEQSGNIMGRMHGDPMTSPPVVVQGDLYVSSTVLWDTVLNNLSLDHVSSRNILLLFCGVGM